MRIFCSICKDLFIPYSDVQVTNCGHLYHTSCISRWIKQHRTCPQCRAKLSQPIKIYFDVEKDGEGDASVLEHQVEVLSDKLREREKTVKVLEESKEGYLETIRDIQESHEKLKNKFKSMKSLVQALKGQVANLTRQNELLPDLRSELAEWKNKVTILEKVETLIKGSVDEVNKLLDATPVTDYAVKHLCTFVGILKIQLQKSEEKYAKLDKVVKNLDRSLMDEKKKNSNDPDLIKNLKLRISKLEMELYHTKSSFRDYKKKHPSKETSTASQKVTSQNSQCQYISEVDLSLDEIEGAQCSKSSRDVPEKCHKTNDFMNKLDRIMEVDEHESKKSSEVDKTISQWEKLVKAGTSGSFGLLKSKSLIRSSSHSETDTSRTTSYAFDGLGGRKKLRLGEPTPQEEFVKIKKGKHHKVITRCQSKIIDFCDLLD